MLVLLALGAGCTSPIKSNYARTHTLPPKGEAKTYAFNSAAERHDSFEYAAYCKQVAAALAAYGWRQATAGKDVADKPDYWVSIIYGYTLNQDGNAGTLSRTTAPENLSDGAGAGTDYYANVAAYYAAINITTQPLGEGDAVFTAQIFGSSNTEMIWIIPAMLKFLLKDFPGENVTSGDVTLQTRR